MRLNGWGRGLLNWFAPAREGDRDVCEESDPDDHSPSPSPAADSGFALRGRVGRLALGGSWKGRSVGDMYLRDVDAAPSAPVSISSSMGVMGGGGVSGGVGEVMELARNDDDPTGVVVLSVRGRR